MDDALFTLESEFSAVESEYGVLDDSATTVGYHHTEVPDSNGGASSSLAVSPLGKELVLCELSESDTIEQQAIDKFIVDTCRCKLGPASTPCSLTLSRDSIQSCRGRCAELSHSDLDLVVMSQAHYLRTAQESTVPQCNFNK